MLFQKTKRKVFVSYHHGGDQIAFDEFTRLFADQYDIFYDQSLDERIRSNDPEYINRAIREDFIVGSSVTIVLCGPATWKRKYVDWEIRSTLHHAHALMGIGLPTATRGNQGGVIVPDRLHDNIQSRFAHWMPTWPPDGMILKAAIESAINLSSETRKIQNSRDKMERNLS